MELAAFTIITLAFSIQTIRVWINKRLTRTALGMCRRLREENHELRVRLNGVNRCRIVCVDTHGLDTACTARQVVSVIWAAVVTSIAPERRPASTRTHESKQTVGAE
jgi:hypothetical protein